MELGIRQKLEKQGIRGPKPSSILLGNIPQIIQIKTQFNKNDQYPHQHLHTNNMSESDTKTQPALPNTSQQSILHPKPTYQTMFGDVDFAPNHSSPCHLILRTHQPLIPLLHTILTIRMKPVVANESQPNIIKEMTNNIKLDLGKPFYLSKDRAPLLGHGVVSSSASFWHFQRKLIAPEFFPDKIKVFTIIGMFGMIVEATTTIFRVRVKKSGSRANFSIEEDQALIASYMKMSEDSIVGSRQKIDKMWARYMPSKNNWEIRRVEKEINQMILKVVKDRMGVKRETDFLQKIVEGAKMCTNQDDPNMKVVDVEKLMVDNCKIMYFAGHETTSTSAAWSLMHLTMIIQESLRLYPPALFIARIALEETILNNIKVPKGVDIQITIPLLHHDKELWGNDVHQFKPQRFPNGVDGACKAPHAYLPFGCGSRVCLGQNFAMVELKVILSIILSKFRFELSPCYRHCPSFRLTTEPEHGVL
ncbi:hypothetical protein RND81_02G104500 [Saponaria officinalis]|uniref:Cytochrome P450 n=1 Tax=Saponaria officinalis TaxID=3572 RepID=A0AAW1MKS1_SAPOF